MDAVLGGLGVDDRHEADAEGRVLVSPDDDLVLALGENPPAERLGPESGQGGQIVGVDDDVVESDGHVASMGGMPEISRPVPRGIRAGLRDHRLTLQPVSPTLL